jgi:hypothetical protein
LLALCGWLGFGVSIAARGDDPVPPGDRVRALIQSVGSDDFTTRQAAEESLNQLGAEAFDPLVAALDKSPTDAAQIILSSLERIWLECPTPGADQLERKLHDLTGAPGPYQPAIEAILQRHAALRETRAAQALRKLNVFVKTGPDLELMELQFEANGQYSRATPQMIEQIVIPRSWKGTSDDLWHFQRITYSSYFQIYYVTGSLSESDRLTIASRLRLNSPLQERSEVFLGITSDSFNGAGLDGCLIKDVEPGGAAEAAGLQPYDLITQIDDVKVGSFMELVQGLKTKRSFQEFTVTVTRDYKTITLPVIGLPWELRRFETPPPPEPVQLLVPLESPQDSQAPRYRETPGFILPPAAK